MKLTVILGVLWALGAVCHAKGYSGPARPTVPSDAAPISIDMGDCLKATEEALGVTVADGGDAVEIKKSADTLCTLRTRHKAARERLLAGLAKLVAFFKDQTNHDHSANLSATVKAIQNVVSECVNAVSSQQYCHNVRCTEDPERNFILCETHAAEILDAINPIVP